MKILKAIVQFQCTLIRLYYTNRTKCKEKKYGKYLRVNGPSFFSKNVILGDHCNFNGMRATGWARL